MCILIVHIVSCIHVLEYTFTGGVHIGMIYAPYAGVCTRRGRNEGGRTSVSCTEHERGSGALFPELVSLFRTADGPDYREFASFVRSVLVRGGVAPRRILSEPFRLRVAGV